MGDPLKLNGGRTAWSLSLTKSTNNEASQFSMGWVTGAITGHPNEPDLKLRGITSTIYSWGIAGAEDSVISNFPFGDWGYDGRRGHSGGNIIGALQSGNQVTFYLYNRGDNVADGSVSLTLCTTAC